MIKHEDMKIIQTQGIIHTIRQEVCATHLNDECQNEKNTIIQLMNEQGELLKRCLEKCKEECHSSDWRQEILQNILSSNCISHSTIYERSETRTMEL